MRDPSLENQRDTGRLEAFSDGVIAVAITLLILDIPKLPFDKQESLLQSIFGHITPYIGYIVSFTIIGLFWANHHYMYKYIKRTDHFLLLLNTFALMFLVFIPFATTLLTQHFNDGYNNAAAMVYSGSLLLTSIAFNILWWYASAHYRLIDKTLTPDTLRKITRRYFISIPLYILTLLISAFSVETSLVLYIVIALLYALPTGLLSLRKKQREGTSQDSEGAIYRKDIPQ